MAYGIGGAIILKSFAGSKRCFLIFEIIYRDRENGEIQIRIHFVVEDI